MICRKSRSVAASFVLILLLAGMTSCGLAGMTSCGSSGHTRNGAKIIGEWQSYGIKTDDGISSYDDELDRKTANEMKSNTLEFRDNGKVEMKSNALSVVGTYTVKGNQYELQFPVKDTENNQKYTAYLDDNDNLILTQTIPKGYEGVKPLDSVAYKKR